jgi:hypothetical protein
VAFFDAYSKEELAEIREKLIGLRNACIGTKEFDPQGAVYLSHAIAWLASKIDGTPYDPSI